MIYLVVLCQTMLQTVFKIILCPEVTPYIVHAVRKITVSESNRIFRIFILSLVFCGVVFYDPANTF